MQCHLGFFNSNETQIDHFEGVTDYKPEITSKEPHTGRQYVELTCINIMKVTNTMKTRLLLKSGSSTK